MISAATTHTSLAHAYDRNGVAAALRSQPVQPVAATPVGDDAASETREDKVTLSAAGLDQSREGGGKEAAANPAQEESEKKTATTGQKMNSGSQSLTEAELQMVQDLKQRDREVKTHEQAHLASAGQYARGGPSYTYQQGPDGRRYAIGGEVPIDVSREKTPEETIQKMRTVRRAAMAPASPSPADRSIAAAATAQEAQAMQEMQAARAEQGAEQRKQVGEDLAPAAQPAAQPAAGDPKPTRAVRRTPLDVLA